MKVRHTTPRTGTEAELRRTLSLLEATLEATADGVVVVDAGARLVWANRKFVELWRIPADLMATRDVERIRAFALDQLAEPAPFLARLAELYAQPLAEGFDVLLFKDGRVIERYSIPQRLGEEVVGRVWSFRDVTDRVRSTEELRLHQTLTQAIVDSESMEGALQVALGRVCEATGWTYAQAWLPSDDGTELVGGRIVVCGQGEEYRKLGEGWRFAPGVGIPGRVWVAKEAEWVRDVGTDPRFVRASLTRALGIEAALEVPVIARGEVLAVMEFLVCERRAEDERLVHVVATVAAQLGVVMAQKRAEAALRESEARYRTLVDHSPDAIVVLDAVRGTFVDANDRCLRLYGLSFDELRQVGPVEMSPPLQPDGRPSAEVAAEQIGAALDGGTPTFEWTHRDAAGRDIPCEIRLARLPAAGKLLVRGSITDITERKRGEEAQRRYAAEVEDLYENAPCGYHSLAADGTFVRVNDTELAWLGYTRDEVMGKLRFQDLLTPASVVTFEQSVPAFRATGVGRELPLEMVRKDGTVLPVLVSATAVRNADGTFRVSRAVVMDNTRRARAEAALRESEAKYRSLYIRTPVMMHSVDRDGRILSVSDAWLAALGYAPDEVLGRNVAAFLTPEAAVGPDECPPPFLDAGVCKDVPYRVARKDGVVLDVLLSAIADRDADGHLTRSLAVLVDVTERKRAEERLQRERRLFMGGPVVVFRWVNEPGWPVEYVSPNVDVLFGHPAEDLLTGRVPYASLIHPDDVERVAHEVAVASEAGVPWFEQDYRVVRKDGEVRWIYDFTVVARDADRRITHYEGYVLDVTAWKQAEAALQQSRDELSRYREHLEDLVAARTLELEGVNRELEAFCYSVSHDLRAPLRSIDGFSQAVLEDYGERLDEKGRSHLRRVRAASQRMARLIDDLLNLARVSRGEMKSGRADLSALARSVAADLADTAPHRDVTFVIEDGIVVEGDPHLLRVALENLFENAFKFTSKHPHARIEFGRTEVDGAPAYFVRDDGAGFDMAYTDKLFGAFQRLHTADEFEGTGIGLATVERIVQRHGGRVWAEGAVEKGATFYFTVEAAPRGG